MTDISTDFDSLLAQHNAHINHHRRFQSDVVDEFLKEAYRINAHITFLTTHLLSIRQSYLSTSPPSRTHNHTRKTSTSLPSSSSSARDKDRDRTPLTDTQRDAIDAAAKATLRDLAAGIRQLDSVEQIRRDTEAQVAAKKHARLNPLGGALGRWASGGGSTDAVARSPEERREEERRRVLDTHRENVIWFLRHRLGGAAGVQGGMMETRVQREVERSKSVLWKAEGGGINGVAREEEEEGGRGKEGQRANGAASAGGRGAEKGRAEKDSYKGMVDEKERAEIEAALSPEQLQLFAQENNEMLKRYEDTLDQVRTAERSLLEISELQTTLATNLELQSTRIDMLVEDSANTSTNVLGGNKQLRAATERWRPARMLFYASCGLCAFLVGWDLAF